MKDKENTIDFSSELRSAYLDYSISVIVGRAIPDVRDGLKPVHRRILFTMHNEARDRYVKCARIVGSCLGHLHPHGDISVYGALVRLTQPFSMNVPLADGQGNFGSIDGDDAAAMRYTEARLCKISNELLNDLEKETVSFIPNYDGSLQEPSVLPAAYPNLLVNGSSGISVGFATSILPHNLREIIDGTIALIKNPNLSDKKLYGDLIKGPDFPTEGIIINTREQLVDIMKTGKGSVIVQAEITVSKSGNRDALIVTAVPYQANKAKIVEKISDLVKEKKIKFIHEIRDESDRDGIRVVIELKYGIDKDEATKDLYALTPLQSSLSVNNLAIVAGAPKLLSVREAIQCFIAFRREVITKRTTFDLQKNKDKAHLLEGLIVASKNIDAIIKVIRECPREEGPKEDLMKKFSLSDKQAQSILDMKLSKLSKFEYKKLTADLDVIKEEIRKLKGIIDSDEVRDSVIIDDLKRISKEYGVERRTRIINE